MGTHMATLMRLTQIQLFSAYPTPRTPVHQLSGSVRVILKINLCQKTVFQL